LGPDITGKLVLMAGGVGKDADFSFLQASVSEYVSTLVLYGQDKQGMADVLKDTAKIVMATSFDDAFRKACESAHEHDAVLLSPACASFDMFRSFEHRGNTFVKLVEAL
jgi:UDP-N-acetylmuramoylalanine--D-glutamate ligase